MFDRLVFRALVLSGVVAGVGIPARIGIDSAVEAHQPTLAAATWARAAAGPGSPAAPPPAGTLDDDALADLRQADVGSDYSRGRVGSGALPDRDLPVPRPGGPAGWDTFAGSAAAAAAAEVAAASAALPSEPLPASDFAVFTRAWLPGSGRAFAPGAATTPPMAPPGPPGSADGAETGTEGGAKSDAAGQAQPAAPDRPAAAAPAAGDRDTPGAPGAPPAVVADAGDESRDPPLVDGPPPSLVAVDPSRTPPAAGEPVRGGSDDGRAAVPEPATLALFAIGALALALRSRRRAI